MLSNTGNHIDTLSKELHYETYLAISYSAGNGTGCSIRPDNEHTGNIHNTYNDYRSVHATAGTAADHDHRPVCTTSTGDDDRPIRAARNGDNSGTDDFYRPVDDASTAGFHYGPGKPGSDQLD